MYGVNFNDEVPPQSPGVKGLSLASSSKPFLIIVSRELSLSAITLSIWCLCSPGWGVHEWDFFREDFDRDLEFRIEFPAWRVETLLADFLR